MALPIKLDFPPMDALLQNEIPVGSEWQYEPKWDGFRCLAFRDRGDVQLQSKSGQSLTRYFPELVEALMELKASMFVLDSEIVIPTGPEANNLSFADLLMRIHPAESRVRKLSKSSPAMLAVFDLLVDDKGKLLADKPLSQRRKQLEAFARKYLKRNPGIKLSTATSDITTAKQWFGMAGTGLDGIIAKRLDLPYRSGDRSGMVKVKKQMTADCVVGGFRYGTHSKIAGSLLLGLYNEQGLLDHVGFTSALSSAERTALTPKLEKLIKAPGFTGAAPGGPSRWSSERSADWKPLDPKLVVEVRYDHFTGGRFRHGTKLLRWRPDKAPRQCTQAQVESESRFAPGEFLV